MAKPHLSESLPAFDVEDRRKCEGDDEASDCDGKIEERRGATRREEERRGGEKKREEEGRGEKRR